MSFATVFSSLFAVVLALIAVLALAALALKALRHWQDRFQQGAEGTGPQMRFLRAMPLGQNERAVLMEAQGEVLLIGVTTGGISLLARWPEREKMGEGPSPTPVTGADS
ncbi:flagellar biosynthetic protein FliO [Novosphingobium beihaiensis]|uniref:Flagellar biosynthetic protein FliO n=1 Tax=Novosphingobium beihaiensis TaxID=2930389 RepID=A0ABT0BVV5_9SPHN|nr:flagellar biosynthetic protein FliO [Novosphingobium beihaiensis]MCJ2189083.1 flagellar biosynthetic protein FliO [Novosphingobium beihaiensis]